MKVVVQAALLGLALLADAFLALAVPGGAGRPRCFPAFAAGVALRDGPLVGGAWGFAGGLGLGLLFADLMIGPRALGGLLAGSLPVLLRRLVYVHRASGQAALGAVAGAAYGVALLAVARVRGDLTALPGTLLMGLALDAALTGAITPLLVRLLATVERRV